MDQSILETKLRENGMKVTPQRLAIFDEVSRSTSHPTADKIYQQVSQKNPNISFDTVNRTLLTFSQVGLIDVVEEGMGRRFDPNQEPHHHLRCIQCNEITDFQNKIYDAMEIPKKLPEGFTAVRKRVVLEGICAECQKQKKGGNEQ